METMPVSQEVAWGGGGAEQPWVNSGDFSQSLCGDRRGCQRVEWGWGAARSERTDLPSMLEAASPAHTWVAQNSSGGPAWPQTHAHPGRCFLVRVKISAGTESQHLAFL